MASSQKATIEIMLLNPEVRFINQQLIREFGFFLDKPRFRIVWTGDQFEKREAEYEDRDSTTGLLIRRVTEIREVPKYPYINPPWWLLERRMETSAHESLKDWNGYEPLYLFQHFEGDKYGEYLPPRLDMASLACKMSLVKKPKRTNKQDGQEYEEQGEQTEKDIFDMLKQDFSDMSHSFHHKEAIISAGITTDTIGNSPNLRSSE